MTTGFDAFYSTLSVNPLFALSVILLGGYLLGALAEKIRLPEITGFIVAGLLAGPYATELIPADIKNDLQLLTEIALAIIAFTVGSNLERSTLRRVARPVVFMAFGHLLAAFVFVTLGLSIAGLPISIAVLLGVLAGGSSPGTVVAIVQNERAYGTFVEQLYGVVAVATAVTITLFGLVFSFTPFLLGVDTGGQQQIVSTLISAVGDTALSVALGVLCGTGLHFAVRSIRSLSQTILVTLSVLLLGTSLALVFGLSTLLVNMAMGVIFVNLAPRPGRVLESVRFLSPPLYAVFFVLAGAKLDPSILTNTTILLLGVTYVISRIAGSYIGTSLGAKLGGSDPMTARYLPLCLVPQAGVALGLVLVLEDAPILDLVSPEMASDLTQTITIMLLAILLKEILGPPISAAAVRRGAKIAPKSDSV